MDSQSSSSPIAAKLVAPMLPFLHSLHQEAQPINTDRDDELALIFEAARLCEDGGIRHPDDSDNDEIGGTEVPRITGNSGTETSIEDVLSHLNTLRSCGTGRIHHPVDIVRAEIPKNMGNPRGTILAADDSSHLDILRLCEEGGIHHSVDVDVIDELASVETSDDGHSSEGLGDAEGDVAFLKDHDLCE